MKHLHSIIRDMMNRAQPYRRAWLMAEPERALRTTNAEHRQITGMGLGLYICRNIVEQHRGRIWARSAGEGSGTLISVWLPDRSNASPVAAQAAA